MKIDPGSVSGDTEAERKFMTWRATTTALLLESMSQQNELIMASGKILNDIRDVLSPYRAQQGSSRDGGFDAQVLEFSRKHWN